MFRLATLATLHVVRPKANWRLLVSGADLFELARAALSRCTQHDTHHPPADRLTPPDYLPTPSGGLC